MIARRLLVVLFTATFAGAAALIATWEWFEEDYLTVFRDAAVGYDTYGGRALLVAAVLGVFFSVVAGLIGRWLWLVELALAIAGLGAVIAAGATYEPSEPRFTWAPTIWYWAAVAAASCWMVAAFVGPLIVRAHSGWLRPDGNPPHTRVTLAFVAASASAAALIVGTVGPWPTAIVASRAGVASASGMLVLAAAFVASLGLLSYWRFGNRRALFAVLWLAVAAATVSIIEAVDIERDEDLVSGWGIGLAAGASVGLALSSAIALFHRGRSLLAPTLVENSGADPGPRAPLIAASGSMERSQTTSVPADTAQAESRGRTREDLA